MSTARGTATKVGTPTSENWRGSVATYKVEPPLFGKFDHVVVSSVSEEDFEGDFNVLLGLYEPTPETVVVPSDADGEPVGANEVTEEQVKLVRDEWPVDRADATAEVLAAAGYELVE